MAATEAQIRKNLHRLAVIDPKRLDELRSIQTRAIAKFTGSFDELEAALGMLQMGDHFGWKPLVLIHNKRTIRKYEEILGIDMRTFFPEEGPSADRLLGYTIAKKLGNFWKAVNGEVRDAELRAQRRTVA